ncbi:F-box/WD repeat-containing protein 7-like [Patiria miniata]|uniref:F-box domain-containing protein n=1 Tax=Patiria miniata TaxID=46514 RepID=A0A913ZEB8_PATMI|nr:F-box/WD repeat-containing protein 7-like [Patiria miniata]XP_038049819.1 F-box/WD repeat-containing protein 7-like [Patiria miniata]
MMASSLQRVEFGSLPNEMLLQVLQYLTPKDLCHVALCSKSLRETANHDALWRPLCHAEGWRHFGRAEDLDESTAFIPVDKQNVGKDVNFSFDTVVSGTDWPGLMDTCKWKTVYMKAHHLERNWRDNSHHVVSFEFGSEGCAGRFSPTIWDSPTHSQIYNLHGEGTYLAAGVSNGTVMVWDMYSGKLKYTIHVDICDKSECLKIKNGTIAVGCKDGMIRTYSTQTGQQLQVMSCHQLAVSQLFIDDDTIVSVARPDPRLFYASKDTFEDSDIKVWSSLNGDLRFLFRREDDSKDKTQDVDYVDKTVAAVYVDRTIRLWNAQSGVCMHVIGPSHRMGEFVEALTYCHLNNGTLIVGDRDNRVEMYDVKSGACCKTFNIPLGCNEKNDNKTWSCVFTGKFLVAASDWGTNLRVCNPEGKYIGETKTAGDYERMMHSSCVRGNKLIVCDEDTGAGSLWMIDRENGFHVVKKLRGSMFSRCVPGELFEFWLGDTKLAVAHYFDETLEESLVQVPYIAVHHYW